MLTVASSGRRVHLFDEVPELLGMLGDGHVAQLQAVTAGCLDLQRGEWRPDFAADELRGHLGLLVLEGFLARHVSIGDAACAELLGAGDVLRPWTEFNSGIVSVQTESHWQVVLPTRVALLDSRFAAQIARWPEIMAAIIDRVVLRARWLALHLAVCHIVRVDLRLLIVFWHMADRWGQVTPSGVALRLPLSHELLAGLTAARRPTVTTALGSLRAEGLLERTDEGWLLHGGPPNELEQLRAHIAGRPTRIGSHA